MCIRDSIKPVNPNQVLLSIKKNVHSQQLVTEQTTADYRAEFGRLSSALQMADSFADWCNVYRRITNWEIELSDSTDQSIKAVSYTHLTPAGCRVPHVRATDEDRSSRNSGHY